MPAKTSARNAFHFVTGSDEAEVKKVALELARKLAPNDDPFALETVDGAVATADEAADKVSETIQALLTVPFFGGAKLVWLKSAGFLSDTPAGRSEGVGAKLEQLGDLIEQGIPEGVQFLFSAPVPDKRRAGYKRFTKLGQTTLCDKPDFGFNATEEDIERWVAERAEANGARLSPEAIEVLTARVGAETRQLDQELEKLSLAYGGEKPITAEQVRELVSATRAGGIFDLSNSLAARDLKGTLDCLRQLLRQKESAIGILLAAIIPTIRNLLLAKDLMQRYRLQPPAQAFQFSTALNRLPEEATSHLPRKKDGSVNAYGVGLAAKQSGKFTLEELRRNLALCRQCNLDLVSSQLDDETLLSRLLIQLLSPAPRSV